MIEYKVKLDSVNSTVTEITLYASKFEIESGALVFYEGVNDNTLKSEEKIRAFNNWAEVERV